MATLLTGNDADEISNKELKGIRKFREARGHAFVVDANVHEVRSKAVRKRVRNSHDARLIKAIGEDREAAMCLIWAAFSMITRSVNPAAFDPLKIGRALGSDNSGQALQQMYWNWARLLQHMRLDHAMCIDVAVFGLSPGAVDDLRARRSGTALDNLKKCLDVFIQLGGLRLQRGEGG